VVVNPDGSKTFKGIEIRPRNTDFNFEPKDGGFLLENARARAKGIYDPYSQGTSYDIPFHGNGRTYEPFTDSQLSGAVRREFVYPGSAPPGLLPSATDSTPRFLKNYLEYLDQINGRVAPPPADRAPGISNDKPVVPRLSRGYGNNSSALIAEPTAPTTPFVLGGSPNSSGGLARWIAALAGVDPQNPTQLASPPLDNGLRDDPAWFLQLRR